MRFLARIAAALLGLILVTVAGIFLLSEVGGEVVVLRTTDEGGRAHESRIWLVEDAGTTWLRAGQPEARWLQRLRAEPEVVLTRGDRESRVRAIPVETPEARARVNGLMARDYGIAEALISLVHDENQVVPIRLEPHVAAGPGLE